MRWAETASRWDLAWYNGLQTGVVDGAENNQPTYFTHNHYTIKKFFSKTEHLIIPEILVFSKAAFDKLSEEDQELVKQLCSNTA